MADFFIDLNQNRYYPGDDISGTLTCIFAEAVQTKDIEIYIEGEEKTQWTEKTSEDHVEYSGYNKFLSRNVKMPGALFNPGQYTYRFSFLIPKKVSGSYHNGENSFVRYYAKVIVRRDQGNTSTVIKTFEVIAPVNLKNVAKGPHKAEKTENGLQLNASVNETQFLVGDEIELLATISNPSKILVEKIVAELGMNIEATALDPVRKSKYDYVLLEKQDVMCHVTDNFENPYVFRLRVPQNAFVPNFSQCELYDLFSAVRVTLLLSNYNSVTVTLPVTLGHLDSSTRISDDDFDDIFLYHDVFELTSDLGSTHRVIHDHDTPIRDDTTSPITPLLPPAVKDEDDKSSLLPKYTPHNDNTENTKTVPTSLPISSSVVTPVGNAPIKDEAVESSTPLLGGAANNSADNIDISTNLPDSPVDDIVTSINNCVITSAIKDENISNAHDLSAAGDFGYSSPSDGVITTQYGGAGDANGSHDGECCDCDNGCACDDSVDCCDCGGDDNDDCDCDECVIL